jgi:hypothetical protein
VIDPVQLRRGRLVHLIDQRSRNSLLQQVGTDVVRERRNLHLGSLYIDLDVPSRDPMNANLADSDKSSIDSASKHDEARAIALVHHHDFDECAVEQVGELHRLDNIAPWRAQQDASKRTPEVLRIEQERLEPVKVAGFDRALNDHVAGHRRPIRLRRLWYAPELGTE